MESACCFDFASEATESQQAQHRAERITQEREEIEDTKRKGLDEGGLSYRRGIEENNDLGGRPHREVFEEEKKRKKSPCSTPAHFFALITLPGASARGIKSLHNKQFEPIPVLPPR